MNQSPYKLYTPAVREPLPLRRKPIVLPAPPEATEKPPKVNWLQTLLPPLIMLVVLSIIASVIQARSFFIYTIALMGIYPIARLAAYLVQKNMYDKKEAERAAGYSLELERVQREIVTHIRKQWEFLKREFLPTEDVCKLAQVQGDNRKLWYRTNEAVDFLSLRVGVFDGKPSFEIEMPKGEDLNLKDPLLSKARELKKKYQTMKDTPYLLDLRGMGSVAVFGEEKLRHGLARRLLLDVLTHHRPDEVEVYVLSTHPKAAELWGWLRWAPHCMVFDGHKEFDHLSFGSQAVKLFLERFENYIFKNVRAEHQLFVVDVDGIQQYDDEFITSLISKSAELNISLLFVGGKQVPRSVRGVVKIKDSTHCIFVDARMDVKDRDEKEYHTLIKMDEMPGLATCEQVARSLAGVKLLSSSGNVRLSTNVTLFDVLGYQKGDKLTHENVIAQWGQERGKLKDFKDSELLQFPIGLTEKNSKLEPYYLNLLESKYDGGKDSYHTILIGTTGSGKSEFIKSLILGAAYKYPPQYLNFFYMDFKGGSTIEELQELPHVIGAMTNLDDVLAQRGLIAVTNEIERRQREFNRQKVKDIWTYNAGKSSSDRMPHLLLVLDEFTRGLELLNTPGYDLQEVLEKYLVRQGRSLGIYLLLANQEVNAKVMRLLPNIGWRIALKVASPDQMQFIDSHLRSPKFTGRGYIQPIGEDPVEFQSGYSGDYVQYSNINIKPKSVSVKELLPNGAVRALKQVDGEDEGDQERQELSAFLEMNQVIRSIAVAREKMNIESAKKIYMKPLKGFTTLDETDFESKQYRKFSGKRWGKAGDGNNFLKVPVGFIDLVRKCEQNSLSLDFLKQDPNLLLAGTQTDVISALRSLLFSLTLSHSPDDIQLYMLEFGNGIYDLPGYPHIADIVEKQEIEKIARTIQFFEDEFSKRDGSYRVRGDGTGDVYPHIFLIINNIAGLIENIKLYAKILHLITQESYKRGIHVILTSLPRTTGARVSSNDLKAIKSRIVFPSIGIEDYWQYLENSTRKPVKLTSVENETANGELEPISRAHWLRVGEPQYENTVELQMNMPLWKEKSDADWADLMRAANGYSSPGKIKVLEKKYPLKDFVASYSEKEIIPVGIQWRDLKEFVVPFDSLPSVWGVSGPRESGKTNFLMLLASLTCLPEDHYKFSVFSSFPNQLTDYCSSIGLDVSIGHESIIERLDAFTRGNIDKDNVKTFLLFDDINIFWESESEANREILSLFERINNKIYNKKHIKLVASFNYSVPFKAARSRDALVRSIHDNKTGLCLGFEGDWIVNSIDLSNYKKNSSDVVPPGRGVFVQKGKSIEIQVFWHPGE